MEIILPGVSHRSRSPPLEPSAPGQTVKSLAVKKYFFSDSVLWGTVIQTSMAERHSTRA
jgi:hypothetical protein